MLLKSRLREHRQPRPAPPGAREEGRFDRRPDGWIYLDASLSQRLVAQLDKLLFRCVDLASDGVTRRTFLRRTGEVAFTLALALNELAWMPTIAKAGDVYTACTGCNCEDSHCQLFGACGPSPECDSTHCNSNFECDIANKPADRRRVAQSSGHWAGYDCTSDNTAANAWTECCDGATHKCSDCCTGVTTLPNCNSGSCGVTKHACICRGTTCTSCCTSSGNPC
jgi:hypothetical protein